MHIRRSLALALAAPLLLVGCTDEPTPKIPEPTTPSPTTPSPSESETPEQESPEDFIRRWAAIEAEMENTGDTAEYRELSSSCEACTSLAKSVEELYAAGGYLKWDGWDIRRIVERPNNDNEFVVRVVSSPTEYKETADGPVKRLKGGPNSHLIVLRSAAPSWVVVDKALVAK